jgi:hypothetical protein
VTAVLGVIGVQPGVVIRERTEEQAKYEKMWSRDEYRRVAPGEEAAQVFLAHANPKPGATVIDYGCGTGRGGLIIAMFSQCNVVMVDFAENCLDEDVRGAIKHNGSRLSFVQHDLNKPLDMMSEYGFCTDVMEHLPTEEVDVVLKNIFAQSKHVFLQISTTDDVMGSLIGERLHLTVKPFDWWLEKLRNCGAIMHWSRDYGGHAVFYCSAWTEGEEVARSGVVNNEIERIEENVAYNLGGPWNNAAPHIPQEAEVMLVAGGPSLAQFEKEIAERRAEGTKLVTVNGAYNWAVERGLKPGAQIIVDTREFNSRFTKPVQDNCVYLLASQCHPSCFVDLPAERTWLWHIPASPRIRAMLDERYGSEWYPVPGGSTVVMRAIALLRMLGFKRFSVYGFDSCVVDDRHHGYAQAENDGDPVFPVLAAGRKFMCTAWHLSQAQEFIGFSRWLGSEVELDVKGDGLIAWIIKSAAEMVEREEFTIS